MEDAVVLVVIVDGLVVVAGADRCTLADVLVDVVVDVVASLPVSVTAVAFTCFHVVDSVCPGPVLAVALPSAAREPAACWLCS